jgi:hypothetical protein
MRNPALPETETSKSSISDDGESQVWSVDYADAEFHVLVDDATGKVVSYRVWGYESYQYRGIVNQLRDGIGRGTSTDEIQRLVKANLQYARHIRWYGITPLHEAVKSNRYDLVPLLVADGLDVNARITGKWDGGATPLYMALCANDEKMVGILLECGADVNIPDKDGHSSLYEAKEARNETIIDLLEKKGAK